MENEIKTLGGFILDETSNRIQNLPYVKGTTKIRNMNWTKGGSIVRLDFLL